MVDVDHIDGLADASAQDLHVARHDDELDLLGLDDLEQSTLGLGFRVLGDGQVMERDAGGLRDGRKVGVIRHDADDRHRELAVLGAEEQVVERVADLRDH